MLTAASWATLGLVLNQLPDPEESLAIWDGLAALATVKSFYNLNAADQAAGPMWPAPRGVRDAML